jgi:hypothetical protein
MVGTCCSSDLECSTKNHVLKAWEVGPIGLNREVSDYWRCADKEDCETSVSFFFTPSQEANGLPQPLPTQTHSNGANWSWAEISKPVNQNKPLLFIN